MWLFVHRFPVEIRNQCIEAIMFIVMKQTLVSITIWCQIKIEIKELRATKEIKYGIWDILGNIPHFKVNTPGILVPSYFPFPFCLTFWLFSFLWSTRAPNWSTVQIHPRLFKTRCTWSLSTPRAGAVLEIKELSFKWLNKINTSWCPSPPCSSSSALAGALIIYSLPELKRPITWPMRKRQWSCQDSPTAATLPFPVQDCIWHLI